MQDMIRLESNNCHGGGNLFNIIEETGEKNKLNTCETLTP